jgi:hypothetical protein
MKKKESGYLQSWNVRGREGKGQKATFRLLFSTHPREGAACNLLICHVFCFAFVDFFIFIFLGVGLCVSL